MANEQQESPQVIPIPPPLVYAGTLVIGLRFRRLLPGIPLPRLLRQILGALLLSGGAALSAWFFLTMRQADTPVNPRKPVRQLVVDGPFQLTRNPGYLGMAAIYSGVALLVNALSAILLLPGVLLIITRGVIKREEQYLERRFGDAYRSYMAHVHRWL